MKKAVTGRTSGHSRCSGMNKLLWGVSTLTIQTVGINSKVTQDYSGTKISTMSPFITKDKWDKTKFSIR